MNSDNKTKPQAAPDKNTDTAPARRKRLPREVRREQILDAALIEFSSAGFDGSSMSGLAQRTGLTKAGLYAHYASKEQILEALLLERLFKGSAQPQWQWPEGATLEQTIDDYLARLYGLIRQPQVQATLRLLITESGRAPARIQSWSSEVVGPLMVQRQREFDQAIEQGLVADNLTSRKVSLASAPALQAIMSYWLLAADEAAREVAEIRAAHREMLLRMFAREEA